MNQSGLDHGPSVMKVQSPLRVTHAADDRKRVLGATEKGRPFARPFPGMLLPRYPGGAVRPSGHPVRDDAGSGGDGECDVVVGTYVMALHRAAMLGESSVFRLQSILVRPRHDRSLRILPSFEVLRARHQPRPIRVTAIMVEAPGTAPGSSKIMSLAFIAISGSPAFHHPTG